MLIFKKLLFAPLVLASFISLIYLAAPITKSYDLIFSLSSNILITLISISILISFSSLLFILLAAIAQDWRISIPVATIGSVVPFLFMDFSLAVIFAAGIFLSLLLANLNLNMALKSYLNFQSSSLLGPSIKRLSGLLILTICIVYFFSAGKIISQNGFQIPDALIETALNFAPLPESTSQTKQVILPQLLPEQIDLLKKNPEFLEQSGLDPKLLDSLNQPQSFKASQDLTHDLIKQAVKDQIQDFIKPYINFVPAVLAVLLFVTLQSFTSLANLLIYPLLWLTFFILEKTGFVKFEVEQRSVRKMVV